jgi:hypothetical protein
MNECEFCKSTFPRKNALTQHQKTAKYCLTIQGKPIEYAFECPTCKKKMKEKRQLDTHQEKCSLNKKVQKLERTILMKDKKIAVQVQQIQDKNETINSLQKQISELQDKLKDVAVQGVKKSTTTNILKLQPLTKEWLDANAKNLTLEHIQRGAIGYAEFASENSFKDRVKCVDASRQILQYKEEDSVIRDKKGKRLAKKFFESIQSQNKELITDAMTRIRDEMDGKSNEEIDPLLAKMEEFADMKTIDLVKNEEMKLEFVKELCDLL